MWIDGMGWDGANNSIIAQCNLDQKHEARSPVREVDRGQYFLSVKKPIIVTSQNCTFTKGNCHNQC